MSVETELVPIENPSGLNVILGQTHFIKTAEDIHEALIGSVPGIKFGVAFCEASGPCLVRVEGNDESLKSLAAKNALAVGAGPCFIVFMTDAYPINVLRALRDVPEIVTVYAATANPVDVVVETTRRGRGALGAVDGERTKGLETAKDRAERIAFLRKIGYKLGCHVPDARNREPQARAGRHAHGVPSPRRYREELPGFRMPAAESKIGPPRRLGNRLHRPGRRVLCSRSREGDGGPEVRGRGTAAVARVQSPADPRGPPAVCVEEGHDPGALFPSVPPRGRRPGPVLRPQRRDRGFRRPRRKDRLSIHLRPLCGIARNRGAADFGVQASDRQGEGRHRRGIPAEGRVVYVLVNRWGPRDRASGRPHVRAVLYAPRDGDRGGPHRLLGGPPDAPGALAHAPERRIRRAPAVTRKSREIPRLNRSTTCSRGNTSSEPWRRKSARRWDEGLNNSCFVRIPFFCRGRTDKVREVEITTQCPECRGDHLVRDYSRAEIVCEDCGLVLDDMIIDEGPEWRAFDSEQRESRERAGPPSTIMAHDKGLSTSIGLRDKDA